MKIEIKTILACVAMVGIAIFQAYTITGKDAEIKDLKLLLVEVAEGCGYEWQSKGEE